MGQLNVYQQVKDSNFVQMVGSEIVDKDDLPIPGVPAVPWATFVSGGFDLTIARNIMISDRKVRPNGGWPLFSIDPTATTQKRILQSRTLYVDTVNNLLTNYPAASWPWMTVFLGDLGIEVFSNGARWLPVGGQVTLFQGVYGTLTSPSKNTGTGASYQFDIGTPTIPGGLIAAGDMFHAGFRVQRHNGASPASIAHKMTFGTSGTNTDAAIWSGSIPSTDLAIVTAHCEVSVGSTTAFTTNSSAGMSGTGGAGFGSDGTASVNFASPMIFGINGGKNTNDTLDLLHFYLKWSAR